MTASTAPSEPVPVLKWRWIAVTAVAVAAVTGVLLWLFLAWSGRPDAPVRIDAVKTAFGVGAGAGGVFALWLATRRQRTLEVQLAETTRDLEERRVTELYTKAVEQLGSDKAPVRLGGLYALERLGQDNPKQRQTIVNVWCAYLRMPFKPPAGGLKGNAARDLADDPGESELLVRLAVQELLKTHLSRDAPGCWPGMSVDLQRATLVDFRLSGCTLAAADFSRARFVGQLHIRGTHFAHQAGFYGAEFRDIANFDRSVFEEGAFFSRAHFARDVRFTGIRSGGRFEFPRAVFAEGADFDGGEHQELDLTDAQFPEAG
ncbi:pentapeptide repeat-containing protein [Amycolatopsis sp. NPDC024027]|uniref:pentapeptide repeat-containing protein n=1 Tax=Amycolatopsis sp. NPDC024027 TaxID=3154327 RepID=UPI0033FB1848